MDMQKWCKEIIAADRKKALPVLSFPAVQMMNISVKDIIGSSDYQAEAMRLVAERVDSSAAVSFMDLSVEAEAFGSHIIISDEEVPTVVGSIIDEDSLVDDLVVPEVGAGRTGLYLDAIKKVSSQIVDRPVFAGVIGPFSLAGRLMDVTEVMMLCYDEPELVQSVLDKCTEFLTAYAAAYKRAGANGIVMAEPLAGLLSPDLVATFSSSYVKRIIDAVQDDSFAVIYHNCGGGVIKSIDSLLDTGAAGYHFGNAIQMSEIVPLIPPDRLVMGNVDPAGELRNGTPESIRKKTLEIMGACCSYSNFIISTGCDIPPMSPWENIDAFFAAVEEFYGEK